MEKVTREINGATCVIIYDNPPRRYMTAKGAALLLEAVEAANVDPAIRCLVLTGTDDVFVRHYDVSDIVKAGDALASGVINKADFETGPFADLTKLVSAIAKPVIAAINGVCMGGGFELALACDIRIATTTVVKIGLPETRLNIFPGGGGTQRLPRLIGEAAALNFILRGMVVDASDAQDIGLVHETAQDARSRALEISTELSSRSPVCLSAVKRLIRNASTTPIDEGLRQERHAFAEVLKDDAAIEAMRMFVASPDQDITA